MIFSVDASRRISFVRVSNARELREENAASSIETFAYRCRKGHFYRYFISATVITMPHYSITWARHYRAAKSELHGRTRYE